MTFSDMNRNVVWQNPMGVDSDDVERMADFWGDDSTRRRSMSHSSKKPFPP